MTEEQSIQVEVAYATPDQQMIIPLRVEPGCTVFEAAQRSGICEHFPQINLEQDRMGVFSKAVPKPKEQVLVDGDRVEIYRPLLIDPKEARKARAKKAAAAKAADSE